MNASDALSILRAHQARLRELGVAHAALFGSLARGEEGADSDVDVMVELDPAAKIDLYDYVALTQYIAELFPAPVDVANRETLDERVRVTALPEAIYAF